MRLLNRILLIAALIFIALGDAVFFIFSLIKTLFLLSWNLVLYGAHKLAGFLFKGLPRQKVQEKYHRVNIPVVAKIRYFCIGVVFCLLFLGIPLGAFVLFTLLPNPKTITLSDFPQTTRIFDRNHKLLYALYATQDRTIVPLSEVPPYLAKATIAIEDKNFYKNPGFDILAIFRAGIADLTHQQFEGGSTITQQLVKNSLLSPEQSVKRKLEEIFLSFWTERMYTKDKILELYLNEVPYGGTAWGVEAAANAYFGKSVKELDLAQCAFLAGLPQAPTQYSPFGQTPYLWKKRQADVLSRMEELGYITKQQELTAAKETLTFIQPQTPLHAPHFVMYVKDLLIQKYGLPLVEHGGLNVTTSLDLTLQDMAQQIVSGEVAKDDALHLTNGAALITNPQNGDILAMIGSSDYTNPQWGNVNVTTAFRQPGSSIKIVTYAAALSHAVTAASQIVDAPVSYPDANGSYSPVNYDGRFHGIVTVRQALANSFNIPAVKMLNTIGIDTFVSTGRAMGLSHLQNADQYGLSVTLGSADVTMLDMATAYGTLANLGNRVDLNPILQVTDNSGTTLEEKKNLTKEQVILAGVAFILSDILADNNARSWEFGVNSPLLIPNHFVSVKTGTTNDIRDNWTIGYTPNYVVTVWVGNNDNSPMNQGLVSGITGAAPIWHNIMSNLLGGTKDSKVTIPDDIVTKSCHGKTEYFLRGTENSVDCHENFPTWTPTPQP